MAEARYPVGAPLAVAPLPGPDGTLDTELLRQQADVRRRRSPFEPPDTMGFTPRIVPRNLLRAAQADDVRTNAEALAVRHDALDIGFNVDVEAAREGLSGVSTQDDLASPALQRSYGREAGRLFLDSVTTGNLDVEFMRLRARMARDPGIQSLGTGQQRSDRLAAAHDAKSMSANLTDSSGLVSGSNLFSNLGGVLLDGKAFIRSLVINTVAGVETLTGRAGYRDPITGVSFAGTDFQSAREQASTDFDELYRGMPRIAQLAFDELSPLNIALLIGTAGGSAAIEGMGFKGSKLLASFIKPQNIPRVMAGDVGARLVYENTDNLPIGLRIPLAGAAAVAASSPDSILRAVNNADDLATLLRTAGSRETSTDGVRGVPEFGLREQWPRFWVPLRGGAVTPPTPTNPATVFPAKASQDLFDLQPIQAGLTTMEITANRVRRTIGTPFRWFEDNLYATPALHERDRVQRRIANQAVVISHSIDSASTSFEADAKGRITVLAGLVPESPGAPTLQTIAANYPLFEPHLTPEQRAAMGEIRSLLRPLDSVYESLGHKADVAQEIIDGGFHIPRGEAAPEGFVFEPRISGRPSGGGARAGAERMRKFATQEEAFAADYVYAPMRTAVHDYVTEVGERALDAHIGNYLKSIIDPATGERLAQTAADRVPAGLRHQVEVVRSKIATRRATLTRRVAVQTPAEREAARTAGQLNRATGRADDAAAREAAITPVTPGDLAQASGDVRVAIQQGRWIATDIGGNIEQVRRAQGSLTDAERALLRQHDELQTLIGEADLAVQSAQQAGTEPAWRIVDRQHQLVYRIQRKVDLMTEAAERQAAKVDDLITRGEVYGDLADANRAETVVARQMERGTFHHERQFALAKREVTLLDRELQRRTREAAASGERAEAAALRVEQTQLEINGYTDELNGLSDAWKRAQDAGRPRDRANVALPGLQQYDFPLEVANAINKVLQNEGPLTGKGSPIWRSLAAFNNLYRGARATLDDSVLGVQAWLGLADDPRAYGSALQMNVRAANNERALGHFMREFDKGEAQSGRLTAGQWASQDLSISAGAGEFQLQGGGIENLTLSSLLPEFVTSRLPNAIAKGAPVRAANRMFGFTGTAERLKWASHELETEITRTGRSAQDLLADGTVGRIAQSTNRLTGIADQRFGGDLGEWALFAARNMESRFETVVRGAAGAVQAGAHVATLGAVAGPGVENRMAARALGKLITYGTTFTVMANMALGNETDFEFIKDGRRNPNFMTIRVGDNDFSLFGQWAGLLSMITNVATGDIAGAYRGVSSGLVATGWNLLSGSTFMGDPTGTPVSGRKFDALRLIGTLASTVVPFSAPGVLGSAVQAGQNLVRGDFAGAGAEVLAGGASVGGVRVADITLSEETQRARDESVRTATFTDAATGGSVRAHTVAELADTQGTRLAQFMADSVDAEGKIAPLKAERIARLEEQAKQGDREAAALLVGVQTQQRLAAAAQQHTVNGVLDGRAYRDTRTDIINQQVGQSKAYADELTNLSQSSNPIDRAVAGWYDLLKQAQLPGTGLVDYPTFNDMEDRYFTAIGEDMAARVQANVALAPRGASGAEVELRKVRDQLDKAGYFDLGDAAWKQVIEGARPTVQRLLAAGGVSLSGISDPKVRADLEQRTRDYIKGMSEAQSPVNARMTAITFWQAMYEKAGKYQPGVALQQAIEDVDSKDPFIKAYGSIKGALVDQWGQGHADLVNPAKAWGYIAPGATGVSPLQPNTPPARSQAVGPTTTQLTAEFTNGSSYGQLAIKYGLTENAIRLRIRRANGGEAPTSLREA